MQLIVSPPKSGYINVVQSIKVNGAIQFLWPNSVYSHPESLWSSQPVLHRQKFSVGRLTRYLLRNGAGMFRRFGRALEIVEKAGPVRLREKDGSLVSLHVRCHREGMISELVVPGLRRADAQRFWSGPIFTVNDGSE